MARKIEIVVGADVRNAEKGFKSLGHSASVSIGSLAKLAVGIAGVTAAIGGLNKAARAGISEFSEQQRVAAQTAAAIKSTGQVAGVTKEQIDALGLSLSNLSGIDDEVIKAGENVLLSFTNIRNAAGRGNDIFTQAAKAATDFAARTGKQVPAAAALLGKALQDPASKLAALAKAGIVFTKQQIAQVAALQKTKGVLEAQKVVLQAFAQRFGGAAKALGETLPGQLNVIRERLRDAAGDLVGQVAPAFTRAAQAAASFVKRFSEAQTLRAKFKVVVDGLQGFGRDILAQLQEQIRRVDVRQVVGELQTRLVAALNQIGAFLNRVDYRAIGQALGDGLVRGAQGAAQFLQSVDWSFVGGAVVNGIRDFLAGVNWKALAVTTVKLIVAAFKANVALMRGIGAALGQALVDGLQAVGAQLEKLAIRLALKIVEPFTHIPKLLGGGAFQGIADELQAKLDAMEAAAKHTGDVIAKAVTGNPGVRGTAGSKAPASAPSGGSPAAAAAAPAVAAATAVESAADKASKAFDRLMSKLQLGAEKAGLTKTLADDIAANATILSALRARAAVAKDDLDVQHQITAALSQQQNLLEQQAAAARAARQARQFRALGLGADGGDITPGVANLQKQFASLTDRIGSSGVNLSAKLKAQLAGVRKVLAGEFGQATVETRAQIQQLFQTIREQLNKGSDVMSTTKFRKANLSNLLAASGLTPDQVRRVRQQLGQVSGSGFVPNRQPAFSGAGAFAPISFEANLYVDGEKMASVAKKHDRKASTRRTKARSGPYAGKS